MLALTEKSKNLRKYWHDIDSRVFDLITQKKIAYKREIELNLEEDYGAPDIGQSLEFLTENARFIWLANRRERLGSDVHTFFYRIKEKSENVNRAFQIKKPIIQNFTKFAVGFGQWVHRQLYPRILKNLNLVVEVIEAKKYNNLEIKGDIDVILSTSKMLSKVFIDAKNTLPFYDSIAWEVFHSNIELFPNLSIIPVVIARRIYRDVQAKVKASGGLCIEMEKLFVPEEFANISTEFNSNIADVTRIVPNKLIPTYLTKKFAPILTII